MILNYLKQIAEICGYIAAITTAFVLLIKPLRNKVLGLCDIFSGLECLLRSDMLRTYYKRQSEGRIRQHERENFESEYKAYKALGGNSFMDNVHSDISEWKVDT